MSATNAYFGKRNLSNNSFKSLRRHYSLCGHIWRLWIFYTVNEIFLQTFSQYVRVFNNFGGIFLNVVAFLVFKLFISVLISSTEIFLKQIDCSCVILSMLGWSEYESKILFIGSFMWSAFRIISLFSLIPKEFVIVAKYAFTTSATVSSLVTISTVFFASLYAG